MSVTKCHNSCCAVRTTLANTASLATPPPPLSPPLLLLLPSCVPRPSSSSNPVSLKLSTSVETEEQQAAILIPTDAGSNLHPCNMSIRVMTSSIFFQDNSYRL